jgi:hypothetical protein
MSARINKRPLSPRGRTPLLTLGKNASCHLAGRPLRRPAMKKRPRRYRPSTGARAPAAPTEFRRRRTEQIPTCDSSFPWLPGEAIYGPAPELGASTMRQLQLQLLYGRSEPEDPGR